MRLTLVCCLVFELLYLVFEMTFVVHVTMDLGGMGEASYHADAAEDSICADPWKDVARQTSHCAHNQEKVHHQLDEEDHKDGYVEVGEGQALGDGRPEAV